MAIWIQSLSWALIYALGQGLVVFATLWMVLKVMPTLAANIKYHLSLSALTILLGWFASTWWQQYHSLAILREQLIVSGGFGAGTIQQQLTAIQNVDHYSNSSAMLLSVKRMLPWLSVFYFTGLALMLVRLSAGVVQIFSLRNNGLIKPDALYNDILSSLKSRIHFDGAVQLFVSAKAQVPMVVGFFKPMILMPAAAMAQLTTDQLETILLHELAHIKRYDYLVNILQTVVETILFFNPFVWMISAIIRREREHCCDDLVLDHTRESLSYATALAALAIHPGSATALAVAATGEPNHLYNRIKRIVEMKKNPFSYSRMVAAILIIVSITCSIVWISPSIAGPKKPKANKVVAKSATPEKPLKAVVPVAPVAPIAPVKAVPAVVPASTPADAPDADESETAVLVRRLTNAGLVNEVKGFVLEKIQDKLYIDEKLIADNIAVKYLNGIKQETIKVQVHSFTERQRMHPDANLLQLILPMTFNAGCVDNSSSKKKKGC
ncbi:M56 family metallopeptidase [Flavipsychrobacter stenotrophus]|nr:M56 family metallopeptidase [Flavipsychrobacter stenotrophus]